MQEANCLAYLEYSGMMKQPGLGNFKIPGYSGILREPVLGGLKMPEYCGNIGYW